MSLLAINISLSRFFFELSIDPNGTYQTMKYQWILFDADETLFSFDSFDGLKKVVSEYGIDFNRDDYAQFQAVNQPLWVAYQNKEISAEELQRTRFQVLSQLTGEDPLVLNQALMREMAQISQPLPYTMEMLKALQGRVKMGIITNGFYSMQQKRLDNTFTSQFFEFVVVSESVGVAKPDKQIFEFAFSQMGEAVDRTKILMVGDTLSSDITGANNAGIDSCWFNPHMKPNDSEIVPTYEIQHMKELIALIEN